MLGEQVGEFQGSRLSTRVLPDEGQGPRMEITEQQTGTLCGVGITATVTYVGTMRPNGTLMGEGQGVLMSNEGDAATFRGIGAGRFTRPGAVSWRGTLLYETQSPKFSRLNGIAGIFEYEVDASGKSEGRLYEWK